MRWQLIKLDLYKVAWGYLIAAWAIVAYVLARPMPLYRFDAIAGGLSAVQGMVIAWRIFGDRGSTAAFVYSRSFGRQRLFWHRWGLGMVLQLITLLVVFGIIASGLRSYLNHFARPWYPMVKWYDLNVLVPIGLSGLIGFSIQMFMMLRHRILKNLYRSRRQIVAGLVVSIMAAALCVLGGLTLVGVIVHGTSGTEAVDHYAVGYAVLLCVFAAMASRHCIIHMEIES